MRKKLVAVLLLLPVLCFAQKTYTKAELKRLQDLGRLWGMVHYFHPAMGTGKVVTDSLVIRNAASLAQDPSATNFTAVVANMLQQLGDPSTRIKQAIKGDSVLLFTAKNNEARIKKFSNGYWYIALPTAALGNPATLTTPSLMPDAWDSANGIVLDLRNRRAEPNQYYDYTFMQDAFGLVLHKLAGAEPLPASYERSIYHNGFVNQRDGTNNIYYSGWRTVTKGAASAAGAGSQTLFNKPFAFVVNGSTNNDLVKALLLLQAAKKCIVIFEGAADEITTGRTIDIPLADAQTASLRVSDYLIGDGAAPLPALFVPRITDTTDGSAYLQRCFQAFDTWPAALNTTASKAAGALSMNYVIPKPGAYADNMAPPLGQRLFALYNYWNAIHYFFAYKELLKEPWDDKLMKHLPLFIAATDGVKYALALRALASDIQDSHGFMYNTNSQTPIREVYGYWPPVVLEFINNKLFIVDVGQDSLQDMSAIKRWDEIVSIDGVPVLKAMESWRTYHASSNEGTFRRDVTNTIINGALNSSVRFKIMRNGTTKEMLLKRTGRDQTIGRNAVDFNDDYGVLKKLDGNIGYVNMGALQQAQVDSMFNTFMNTKAIIFDIRNYPRGTAWSIAPRLAAAEKKAVKFEYPFVTPEHITGGEEAQTAISYFTVKPDTTKPRYGGKVIVLCNSQTQSQAEYSIMMFQGATDVTVIGSQTAGADGNVTDVVLPGGYIASFSGLGILYPDGGQTQQTGIRIDIQSKPTLAGLKAGKDEVLERALLYLKTGK